MNMHRGTARPRGALAARPHTICRGVRPYLLLALLLGSCAAPDTEHHIVISTREQKLALLERGNVAAIYPISTSKFGLGDFRGSYRTPVGEMEVAQKIGDGAEPGTVFKDLRRTGEIIPVDAPGGYSPRVGGFYTRMLAVCNRGRDDQVLRRP